jgi:hypothetical protein
VATDDATCDSPDFAVPCQMARDAANDSALDASLCLGGGGGERYAQNSNTKDHCPGVLLSFRGHVVLVEFSGTIPMQAAVSIAGIALMIAHDSDDLEIPAGSVRAKAVLNEGDLPGPAADVIFADVIQPSRIRQSLVNRASWVAH